MEYVSPDGLRLDGRRTGEARAMTFAFDVADDADGSCEVTMGLTRALARCYGPNDDGASARRVDAELAPTCAMECDYRDLTSERTQNVGYGKRSSDRREREFARTMEEALRATCELERWPRSRIRVDVVVVANDGGAHACAMNAAVMALIDAGVAVRDTLACASVGVVDGEVLVDLNRAEERARTSGVTMGAFSGDLGQSEVVMEVLERGKVSVGVFEEMHAWASAATGALAARMRRATLKRTRALAESRALEKF